MEYYSTLEQVKGYLERRISLRPDQATDAGAPRGAAVHLPTAQGFSGQRRTCRAGWRRSVDD